MSKSEITFPGNGPASSPVHHGAFIGPLHGLQGRSAATATAPVQDEARLDAPISQPPISFEDAVRRNLEWYFTEREGGPPGDLHALVVAAIERPLLVFVMQQAEDNQVRAAAMLGINRNTLRKKLLAHDLL